MAFRLNSRALVFTACFSALFIWSSYLNVTLGFSPVPISLENFVVMLAGAILGPLYGFLSIALVLLLTALGLPIIHGSGGLSLLLGATGGYLWMDPLAALGIGWVASRLKGRRGLSMVALFAAMEVFGSLLLYVGGVPWLANVAGYSFAKAMSAGCYPYLPGDAVKALIAAPIAMTVRQVFPMSRILGLNRYGTANSSKAA
ncbi:biotin transporter BioY [Gorillibacterium sp. sgz5001074]|uniref:biotin transporter BioY n=1 Tax=Gorillibacterium sp. sgz5001074 TaxID=3446695 RepID=UPI003F67D3DB